MHAQPRTLVAGAGAVGLYYGARLLAAGHDVTFLARGATAAALSADGLHVRSVDGDLDLPPPRLCTVADRTYDLIVVAVKAYQTAEVLPVLAPGVGAETYLLSLQNGLDNEETLAAAFGAERILGGVAFIGAERTGPNTVRHSDAGHVTLGAWAADTKAVAAAAAVTAQWCAAGIRARHAHDIRTEIWLKLMWNAAFNPATALADLTPGELLAYPEGEALIRAAMAEVREVAAAAGIHLKPDAEDTYIAATRSMGSARTSMHVDRRSGRRLELEAISGAVVRRAQAAGIAVPVQTTMYRLLQGYERTLTAD